MSDKKQQFHLEPPYGLMNDPNGLAWFQGQYYVFFQWNPLAKDHSHKEWGWFTSPDLLHWQFHGSAMAPSEPYDQSGVHSGSALVKDGQLRLYYTGSDKSAGRRHSSQCLAVLGPNGKFAKKGIVVETPAGFTEHFRDPSVLRLPDGTYRMLLGAQRVNGFGAIAIFASEDALTWEYSGILGYSDEYEMVECPDLVAGRDGSMLLYGLQHRDNDRDATLSSFSYCTPVEVTSSGITPSEQELTAKCRVDDGFDFYAPQTFRTPDGRTLLLAWMSRMDGDVETVFSQGDPYVHCLTMPREVEVSNGRLRQRPARELRELLASDIPTRTGPGDALSAPIAGRTFHLDMTWDRAPLAFDLTYEDMCIQWNGSELSLGRRLWTDGDVERRTIQVQLSRMEIWTDTSSLELFINNGDYAMSARFLPTGMTPTLHLSSQPGCSQFSLRAICPSR